jgi:hypothetical protein
VTERERLFWMAVRRALLALVAAIEKLMEMEPRG